MVKEFIPYDLAVAMKRIGFNEECLATFAGEEFDMAMQIPSDDYFTAAPLFQQAFRWFRERKYLGEVLPIDSWGSWSYRVTLEDWMSPFFIAATGDEYTSYEEAQIKCLKKLIEIYENI